MKLVRCFAIIPLLALAVTGCERSRSTRVVDPPPDPEPAVVEAHWVTEKEGLASAVRLAAASPLVRRAFITSPHPRLTAMHRYAIRAVATMEDGAGVGVTILPYMVDEDSTHAALISLIDGKGVQVAEFAELIFGREPTSLEMGFISVRIEDQIAWVKSGHSFLATADGADGVVQLSPERRNWVKFAQCFFERAPGACSAGADIAGTIAPNVPYARAVGCAAGTAIAAGACAGQHLAR
jgi:hypothetical protein